MPTIKQKLAFHKTIENRGNVSRSMREVGYKEATARNPKNLTKSKGWQTLITQLIDDSVILGKVYEVALQEDKRMSLQAIDMLFRLKDRYPNKKLKAVSYQQELMTIK